MYEIPNEMISYASVTPADKGVHQGRNPGPGKPASGQIRSKERPESFGFHHLNSRNKHKIILSFFYRSAARYSLFTKIALEKGSGFVI